MNRFLKVLVPLLLVMALLTASMPAFAASAVSPTEKVIGNIKVYSTTYDGKVQRPRILVWNTLGKRVRPKYYDVKVAGTPKNAGRYVVTVTGKGVYTGSAKGILVIKKARNPFTIVAGKTTFKYSATKQQSTSIKVVGIKEKAQRGHWLSSSYRVHVHRGKLIVSKGFKGEARVAITTLSTTNYKKTRKAITITAK